MEHEKVVETRHDVGQLVHVLRVGLWVMGQVSQPSTVGQWVVGQSA